MKITKDNILIVEHKLFADMCLWEVTGEQKDKVLGYIQGIHDMADAVIKMIEEVRNG